MDYAEIAIKVSTRAVQCDTKGEYRAAVYYYKEALNLLDLAYKEEPNHPDAIAWCKKMHEYADRSHFLQYQSNSRVRPIQLFMHVKCYSMSTYHFDVLIFSRFRDY